MEYASRLILSGLWSSEHQILKTSNLEKLNAINTKNDVTRSTTKKNRGYGNMPIYEYHCNDCDKTFESLVFGSETPGCPFCNSVSVLKKMSACRFVSKGGSTNGVSETIKTSASASPCSGCSAASCAGCSST